MSSAIVLDATFFFTPINLEGTYEKMYTTPQVVEELRDLRGKARYNALLERGLIVSEPENNFFMIAFEAAQTTHNDKVLSSTDISVIALALELSATVATDDFAIQHTARTLHIPVQPLMQRRAKKRDWILCCIGCGAEYETGEECLICGAPVKKRNRERKNQKKFQ
ncbi:MAG: nucleotide-binding protein [Methanomicrobiales archaeon]|nr:nucleotide-binding protein [Methanomicrobiales archaeon]